MPRTGAVVLLGTVTLAVLVPLATVATRPTRAVAAPARPAARPPLVSPTGYYEGSVLFNAQYMKDRAYMGMGLGAKADYWFTVTESAPGQVRVSGSGVAFYNFGFAVDWGLSAKAGISLVNVLGAKLDPKVSLTLDPSTAVQKFALSGEGALVREGDVVKIKDVALTWVPRAPATQPAAPPAAGAPAPNKIRLNLVGSVTADVSGSGEGEGSVTRRNVTVSGEGSTSAGGSRTFGTVIQTIEIDPLSPFGSDKFTFVLNKRSPYGPYADEFDYDGAGGDATTGVTVHAVTVQKIDFLLAKRLAGLLNSPPP